MNELQLGEFPVPEPETTAPVRHRGFALKGLVPAADPFHASGWAVANLKNVVKVWPADSMLVVTIQSESGGISLSGWVNEYAPDDWFDDLKYIMRPIARLKRSFVKPRLSTPVVEIVPIQTDHADLMYELESTGDRGTTDKVFGRDAVPVHINDPMWDLMREMKTWDGAAVSFMFSPATTYEQDMVASSWRQAFEGGAKAEGQTYLGTPMRARTLVHGAHGRVPARSIAELTLMSPRTEARILGALDRQELADPTVDCLKGSPLPEGAVGSIVHLPAAGQGHAVPGMKVLAPPRFRKPYDPAPKPADGVRLGRCVDSHGKRRSVWLSTFDLCRHVQIVGSTGSGKSTAARTMIDQLIDAGYGVLALAVDDSLPLAVMGDVRDGDKVAYVDFSDTRHPVPFNPLYAQTDAEFEARLQGFMNVIVDRDSEEYTGPRWRRAFGVVARGCWALFGPRTSLIMVFSILGSRELCRELVTALNPVDKVLADQVSQELGSVSGDSNSDLWSWLVCKGEEVLGSQALQRVLGTGANALDVRRAMDESQVILVNLGLAELGERSAQLVGCTIVSLVQQAMRTRQDRSKPFFLFIDEAHLFQYGALAPLLDEARKFGVAVIVCHQRPGQLRPQIRDSLSTNPGSRIQGRTSNPQDAATASVMYGGWPVGDFVRMRDLTAAAIVTRDGVPSEPFSIEFDFFKRNADLLDDKELRDWRVQRVRHVSYCRLVQPYEELPVVTRDSISASIDAARRLSRDHRLEAMTSAPKLRPTPAGVNHDVLPRWLS